MVSADIIEEQELSYLENIETWIKQHPGEYVLIDKEPIFFLSEAGLNAVISSRYKGELGPTIFTREIPREMTSELRTGINLAKLLKNSDKKLS